MWWPAYTSSFVTKWGSLISRERIDLESPNFTWAFAPVGSITTPDLTSMTTSSWQKVKDHCFVWHFCRTTDLHRIPFDSVPSILLEIIVFFTQFFACFVLCVWQLFSFFVGRYWSEKSIITWCQVLKVWKSCLQQFRLDLVRQVLFRVYVRRART